MCLLISCIFLGLAYTFLEDGNMQGLAMNLSIALLFITLFIRNIYKTKKEKSSK